MGWSSCGTDNDGRPIGYGHSATCDYPGCEKGIDRGLSYACGDHHGGGEYFCDKYFCSEHLYHVSLDAEDSAFLCPGCEATFHAVHVPCEPCGGWGYVDNDGLEKCSACKTRGWIMKPEHEGAAVEWRAVWTDPNTMGDDPPEDVEGPWHIEYYDALRDKLMFTDMPPKGELEHRIVT